MLGFIVKILCVVSAFYLIGCVHVNDSTSPLIGRWEYAYTVKDVDQYVETYIINEDGQLAYSNELVFSPAPGGKYDYYGVGTWDTAGNEIRFRYVKIARGINIGTDIDWTCHYKFGKTSNILIIYNPGMDLSGSGYVYKRGE